MVRIIYVVVAIIVPLLFLTSCGQNETPVVTEVVMIDGQEIVVTRVAQTTVEIAVTPDQMSRSSPITETPLFLM